MCYLLHKRCWATVLASVFVALAVGTAGAETLGTAFGLDHVRAKAEEMASRPFENPDGQVPDFLLNISYDDWRKVRFLPDHSLWRDENLPFEVQFFHPGLFYNRLVNIHIIDTENAENSVTDLPLSVDMFNYGDDALAEKVRAQNLGFAGFRLHFPIKDAAYKDEVVVFLGASYFRAVGKNTQYGLSARGLAVDTGLAKGEEFPYFREFWLEKPLPGSSEMTVYAIMDSPSLVGAYRFVIKPGVSTVMDVECSIFFRSGATKSVDKIGLGALTSMFLFGETENGQPGDYRPEVHDSDGLLVQDADDQWQWFPLDNPKRLAILPINSPNPKGFGLMQRDANFDHYQDLEARYEQRPSLWVQPKGNWGLGRLELIEIPSIEEIHDNMVAFWVPSKVKENPDVPESPMVYPSKMNFAYTLHWMSPGEEIHHLGRAISTRTARAPNQKSLRFIVDFAGGTLQNMPQQGGLTSVLTLPHGVELLDKQLIPNPETHGWRLVFNVNLPDPGVLDNLISTRKPNAPLRFRALLKQGENFVEPLTETWAYDLQL